jgi:hypothetical protein
VILAWFTGLQGDQHGCGLVGIEYPTDVDLPVACTLTDAEMREGRSGILDAVRRSVLYINPLPEGYAYHFDATSEILSQLASLVDLERQCCAFLRFRIIVEAGRQPICLEITGSRRRRSSRISSAHEAQRTLRRLHCCTCNRRGTETSIDTESNSWSCGDGSGGSGCTLGDFYCGAPLFSPLQRA